MNDTLNKFFIFAAGFAAGVVVTRMVFKHYESQTYDSYDVNEGNIEREFTESLNNTREDEANVDDGPTMTEYKAELKKHNYIDYSSICCAEDENKGATSVRIEEDTEEYEPTIISPEELGELEGYDVIGLIFYADRVLTDDMNEPVDNADEIIGHDALNHFGEYNDDSVCVRNDKLKVDYEILLDDRRYSDVIKKPLPSQMEE